MSDNQYKRMVQTMSDEAKQQMNNMGTINSQPPQPFGGLRLENMDEKSIMDQQI